MWNVKPVIPDEGWENKRKEIDGENTTKNVFCLLEATYVLDRLTMGFFQIYFDNP